MIKYVLTMALIISCSHAPARDWTPWMHCGLSREEEIWRFCHREKELDPSLHNKGLCFVDVECRERKTILGNIKKEMRSKQLYCAWGDIDCKIKNALDKKVLVTP